MTFATDTIEHARKVARDLRRPDPNGDLRTECSLGRCAGGPECMGESGCQCEDACYRCGKPFAGAKHKAWLIKMVNGFTVKVPLCLTCTVLTRGEAKDYRP